MSDYPQIAELAAGLLGTLTAQESALLSLVADAVRKELTAQLRPDVDPAQCAEPLRLAAVLLTVPVLYVVPKQKGDNAAESIRRAFVDVYIKEKKIATDNLPVQFMIVDDIPLNTNGKLDIYRITRERLQGSAYNIVPVRDDSGSLIDIKTEYVEHTSSMTAGTVPEGMDGRSSYNLFDLFNAPPQKKEAPKGFGSLPFGMPFPFGMMNNPGMPEREKPEIPQNVKDGFMKLGNRIVGKIYNARDIDFDIED